MGPESLSQQALLLRQRVHLKTNEPAEIHFITSSLELLKFWVQEMWRNKQQKHIQHQCSLYCRYLSLQLSVPLLQHLTGLMRREGQKRKERRRRDGGGEQEVSQTERGASF